MRKPVNHSYINYIYTNCLQENETDALQTLKFGENAGMMSVPVTKHASRI